MIRAHALQPEPEEPAALARWTGILRVRADAYYDKRDWAAALAQYRRVLLKTPDELSVVERVAECLDSLRQVDAALEAYADLSRRLQDRGRRLLAQLDHRGAARDLGKAVTIRLWLVAQGRREVEADLAESYSRCADAFVELLLVE